MIILNEREKNRTKDDKLHIPMLGVGFLETERGFCLEKRKRELTRKLSSWREKRHCTEFEMVKCSSGISLVGTV